MKKRSFISLVATAALLLAAAAPAQAQRDASVRIFNRSSYTVFSIHVSPTHKDAFGRQDLLGSDTLDAGYNRRINFNVRDAENFCVLDILAEGSGTKKWTKRINVCEEATWTLRDSNMD